MSEVDKAYADYARAQGKTDAEIQDELDMQRAYDAYKAGRYNNQPTALTLSPFNGENWRNLGKAMDYGSGATRGAIAMAAQELGAPNMGVDLKTIQRGQVPESAELYRRAGVPEMDFAKAILEYTDPQLSDAERKNATKLIPSGRTLLGFGSDVAADPVTWAPFLGEYAAGTKAGAKVLEKTPQMVKSVGQKAGRVLTNGIGDAMQSTGTGMWRSAFKNLDQYGQRFGKEANDVSNVLIKNNITGSAAEVFDKMDELGRQLKNKKDKIINEATQRGAEVDMNAAVAQAQAYVDTLRAEGQPDGGKLVDALQKRIDAFKAKQGREAIPSQPAVYAQEPTYVELPVRPTQLPLDPEARTVTKMEKVPVRGLETPNETLPGQMVTSEPTGNSMLLEGFNRFERVAPGTPIVDSTANRAPTKYPQERMGRNTYSRDDIEKELEFLRQRQLERGMPNPVSDSAPIRKGGAEWVVDKNGNWVQRANGTDKEVTLFNNVYSTERPTNMDVGQALPTMRGEPLALPAQEGMAPLKIDGFDYGIPAEVTPPTPMQPAVKGPTPWQADRWKTNQWRQVGSKNFKEIALMPQGKQFDKAMGRGLKAETENSVGRALGPEAAKTLEETNSDLGKILTSKDRAKMNREIEANKNYFTSVDGMGVGLAMTRPDALAVLAAKKAADATKMSKFRTVGGKFIRDFGEVTPEAFWRQILLQPMDREGPK